MGRIPVKPARLDISTDETCPMCSRFLIYADGRYRCRLHGSFTATQIKDEDFRAAFASFEEGKVIRK